MKYFLQRIFFTMNNYNAYYTLRHSTCSRSTLTATAYRLEDFLDSLSHTNASNRRRPYVFIYVVATNTIPFEKHFHGSYSLRTFFDSRLLCCKIFVLKYFRRMSTLQKFFNTKIFPTKISYNENFPIYGISFASIKYIDALNSDHFIW